MRQIKASEFKAKCLKLIDEVALGGEPIVITKRGKAVVRVERERSGKRSGSVFGRLRGLIKVTNPDDDLISILSADDLKQIEANRE